jgi:hypothetical protein
MTLPRFLVENFFNEFQFDGHTLVQTSQETHYESWNVADGRRDVYDYWTPTQYNTEVYIGVECDQAREADMIVIDRVHNLSGETITLKYDEVQAFSSPTTVFTLTVPSTVVTGDDLTATPGVLTEEGAWAFAFTAATKQYWRLYISAMGAGERPYIGGLWLGKSFTPTLYLDLPFEENMNESFREEIVSDTAWIGSTRTAKRRVGTLHLKCAENEFVTARYHFDTLFQRPHAMWIVFDQDGAETAVCALPKAGVTGFAQRRGWNWKQASLPWFETEPLPQ